MHIKIFSIQNILSELNAYPGILGSIRILRLSSILGSCLGIKI